MSQARSSGRNPEFFWFERQFFRSISRCAMFQSPHRMNSRPEALISRSFGMKRFMKENLRSSASSPEVPEGT